MNDETNLIEEVREAGRAYVASLRGDVRAICADLRRRAREEGRQVVSLPPKPPHPWHLQHIAEKKAG